MVMTDCHTIPIKNIFPTKLVYPLFLLLPYLSESICPTYQQHIRHANHRNLPSNTIEPSDSLPFLTPSHIFPVTLYQVSCYLPINHHIPIRSPYIPIRFPSISTIFFPGDSPKNAIHWIPMRLVSPLRSEPLLGLKVRHAVAPNGLWSAVVGDSRGWPWSMVDAAGYLR